MTHKFDLPACYVNLLEAAMQSTDYNCPRLTKEEQEFLDGCKQEVLDLLHKLQEIDKDAVITIDD